MKMDALGYGECLNQDKLKTKLDNSKYNTHHNKHNNEWKENKDSEGGGHSLRWTLPWNAEHVLKKTVTNN